jgi:hypothetical protein
VTRNEQEKKADELSRAIDQINQGQAVRGDQEVQELAETALLLKRTILIDSGSKAKLDETVDRLARELGSKRRKRRAILGFSGAAGIVAAGLMLFALNANIFSPNEENRTYTQTNPSDLTKIVQIQREQETPAELAKQQIPPSSPPVAPTPEKPKPQAPPAAQGSTNPSPAASGRQTAPEIHVAAKKAATKPTDQAGQPAKRGMLALAGRTANSVTTDTDTGEIRKVYRTESGGEITLVQGRKAKSGSDISVAAVPSEQSNTVMRATEAAPEKDEKQQEKGDSSQSRQQSRNETVNRVTVSVDGVDASVEGKMPEEELQRIAETVVKE